MKAKLYHLEATRIIHDKLKGSKLSATIHRKIKKELAAAMDFFGIPAINAMLLSSIVQESLIEGEVELKALVEYYEIDSSQTPSVWRAVEELCEAGLITKDDRVFNQNRRKVMPFPVVMDALMKDDKKKVRPKSISGICDLFTEYKKLQSLRTRANINHTQFINQVVKVCDRSGHLPAVQYIRSLELSNEEIVMLIFLAIATFEGKETAEIGQAIGEITDNLGDHYDWCARFRSQELTLFKEELIEFSFFELGLDTDISLTQLTRERLFANDPRPQKEFFKPRHSQLILPQSIPPVDLIFDEGMKRNMDTISHSMEPANYNLLCAKLKERNLRGGLVVLFHGLPGTGKTESVYQLARKTNRAILRLEISQIKAMWVGESEKNLKKVFIEYKQAKRIFKNHPILLFNEADAIFSRRRNVGSSVDQMENSLQNILLQELEEFDGILIATTNLTQNLDNAFERRFLYKLNFRMPEAEARLRLLTANFERLSESDRTAIALNCEFTGSTIENIKRKLALQELFEPAVELNAQAIKDIIINECASSISGKTRIGFRIE